MAKCDPFQYTGITRDVFNSIASTLASKGFALSGPSGTVHGPFGIVIDYEWNEESQTLNLEVVDKNFFVSCHQIKEQIESALKKFA
jgi:hypothetical protein